MGNLTNGMELWEIWNSNVLACVCAGGGKSALGLGKCVAEPLSERFDCVQTSSCFNWAAKCIVLVSEEN